MFTRITKFVFRPFLIAAIAFAFADVARAGFLYVLNERNAAPNQIYGFNVNESTGALTPLAGFPISSGGNGLNTTFSELLTIDRANFRLYVLNAGSDTISAFSINLASGALTHYDGDGRHDATVYRPSQATWFSQRSTAGTLIQQFGAANDRPIPNAFVPIPN